MARHHTFEKRHAPKKRAGKAFPHEGSHGGDNDEPGLELGEPEGFEDSKGIHKAKKFGKEKLVKLKTGDNVGKLGHRIGRAHMSQPGQDAEASTFPAMPSRNRNSKPGQSISIATKGHGRGGR